MSNHKRDPFSVQLCRLLLTTCPPRFRRRFGAEMLQVVRAARSTMANDSILTQFRYWLVVSIDLWATVCREWILAIQLGDAYMMDVQRFDRQLVDTLSLLSRSLRQGYSVLQSVEIIAQNAPEPTATAFRNFAADYQNSQTRDARMEAIAKFRSQIGSDYFNQVTESVMQQFAEGGNLADRLDTLHEKFRAEIDFDHWADKIDLSAN